MRCIHNTQYTVCMYWLFVSNLIILTCTCVTVGCMWKHFLMHGVNAVTYLHEKKVYLLHIHLTSVSWLHTKLLKGTVYTMRDVLLHVFDHLRNRVTYHPVLKNAQIETPYGSTIATKTVESASHAIDQNGCYVIDYIYPPHKTFTRFLTLHYDPYMSFDIHHFKRVKWIHVSCNHTDMTPHLKSLYVSPHIKLRHLHLYLQNITRNFNLAPMYEVITRTLDDELINDMNSSVC